METQTNSLLEDINNTERECGKILEDNGIVEDVDIQSLCYESLKDLFPGNGKRILQRSKVWKIIQKSLKTVHVDTSDTSSMISSDCTDDITDTSLVCDDDIVEVSTPKPAKHVQLRYPEYNVYMDPEISAAAKLGSMSKELKSRLVRATIHNMISTAASPPFSRYPLTAEIEEMAKSLIIAYPCLRDPESAHGNLFTKLKRKLSNSKPTKKPQGPCPNKRRKIGYSQNLLSSQSDSDGLDASSKQPLNEEISLTSSKDNFEDSPEVMKRHYKLLEKEMKKKNPNRQIVNMYLNKEFDTRRKWLESIPAEERCKQLLEFYPCFTDHIEVVEEARRVLKVESTERSRFLQDCVDRLTKEVDFLLFYGISKAINPPRSPKISAKILHVMQQLSVIFPRPKPLKKAAKLVYELQDHEDADSYCLKQVGNLPMLLIDQEMVYVIIGKIILLQRSIEDMAEAVVGFVASFYLLDFDYPKQHEFGLVMLQRIIFEDETVPGDIAIIFEGMVKAFQKYKAESS